MSIRVLGDLGLLPVNVQKAASNAMYATKDYKGCILNICCPYTSRHELIQASEKLRAQVSSQRFSVDDVSVETVSEALFTNGCPPVDILVRTSGESRLSDFLLWQVSERTLLYFSNVMWPEFGLWNMVPVLLMFQARETQVKVAEWNWSGLFNVGNVISHVSDE